MSAWPAPDADPSEAAAPSAGSAGATPPREHSSLGSVALYLAVLVVVAVSAGALLGLVDPVTGAVIVLGSEVLGTIAFFLTYYLGRGSAGG